MVLSLYSVNTARKILIYIVFNLDVQTGSGSGSGPDLILNARSGSETTLVSKCQCRNYNTHKEINCTIKPCNRGTMDLRELLTCSQVI